MKKWLLRGIDKVRASGVAWRLAGGYLVLIGMIVLVAAIGITNIGKIRSAYDGVLDERIPRIHDLQQIQALLSGLNVNARDALLTTEPERLQQIFAVIDTGRAATGEQLGSLQKALEAEGSKESLDVAQQIGNAASSMLVGLVKFTRLLKADKREPALTVLQQGIEPQLQLIAKQVGLYQTQQIHLLEAVKQEVALKEAAVIRQALVLVAASVLVAALFAWWVVRSVIKPLRDIQAAAAFMARGDFSHKVPSTRRDEVGAVVQACNQTAVGLTALVENIRSCAQQVRGAAEHIDQHNAQLEGRSSEQTQALQVAMGFIDGVQKVIDENVSIASRATVMANDMSQIAVRSSTSVSEAVHEMEVVRQSSQKITDIISLIDGIAFQTNILALNAAVEAARAGEQGRGFAVVASEVRSLAGRSSQASNEIKGLIHASQARVAIGTEKVQSISQIMEEVTQTAVDLKHMVEQISGGSQVQSAHMQDMVQAVAHLRQGNEANAQVVQDMRGSLDDLRHTAQGLAEKVGKFKTIDRSAEQTALPAQV